MCSLRYTVHPEHKKPATGAGLVFNFQDRLFDLGFLVHHVLTNNGIVLFHLHFSGRVLFVFIRGVKVSCAFRGHQADFFS